MMTLIDTRTLVQKVLDVAAAAYPDLRHLRDAFRLLPEPDQYDIGVTATRELHAYAMAAVPRGFNHADSFREAWHQETSVPYDGRALNIVLGYPGRDGTAASAAREIAWRAALHAAYGAAALMHWPRRPVGAADNRRQVAEASAQAALSLLR